MKNELQPVVKPHFYGRTICHELMSNCRKENENLSDNEIDFSAFWIKRWTHFSEWQLARTSQNWKIWNPTRMS